MALAPEWMSYTKEKEVSSSQGPPRMLGRERERGAPKYVKQNSYNNLNSYLAPQNPSHDPDHPTASFACSVSSPPAPPYVPGSILGDSQPRVLNRSKSSPGFGSPTQTKPKPKKSPDRSFPQERSNFPSSNKPPLKPKPTKPTFNPTSFGKSVSQPNFFKDEKTANWHQQKLQAILSPPSSSPLSTSSTIYSPPPVMPPSTSPPLPPSSSPPPALPDIDKLKQLVPSTGPPPKSVRPRGVVGPPLPMAKKAPPPAAPPPSSVAPPGVPGAPGVTAPTSPNSLASYFRKATSEPSLIHHKAAQIGSQANAAAAMPPPTGVAQPVRSKKARAMEAEKAQIQYLLKEAADAKQPNRTNFFQHVIKREVSGPILEDESPIGNDQVASVSRPSTPPTSPPPPSATTPPSASPPIGLRSPLPEDTDREERFLRQMGWVPDEEDPVPVLEEEEIAELKSFFSKNKNEKDDGMQDE